MRCPVCRYKLKKNTVRCPYCASICAKRTKAALHPYYMREFERLARGEAPRFNAAAFFGGMFHTLYYRCYARFFRLFARQRYDIPLFCTHNSVSLNVFEGGGGKGK